MIIRKLTLILSFGYALAIRGGWRPIENLDDENVVAAAEYALYNLEDSTQSYSFADTVLQSNCIFTPKVLDGRQQVVAGMNYDLEIEVLDCDNSCVGVFQTTIYVGFSPDDMEVTNWGSELPCPQPSSWIAGGWSPIENLDDENVVAAAEYALNNLGESTQSYSFADTVLQSNCIFTPNVLDGQRQVVAGMNYDLEIEVLDYEGSGVGAFQATIYVGFSPDDMEVTNWGPELPAPPSKRRLRSFPCIPRLYLIGGC